MASTKRADPKRSRPKGAEKASNAGREYRQLISDQLSEERDRKKSLEQRGIAVITTATALTSLLLALGALVSKSTSFVLPGSARTLVAWALGAFLVTAALAAATNFPFRYHEVDLISLSTLATIPEWTKSFDTGSISVANVEVAILAHARTVNGRKAKLLFGAMCAEVAAVALLAWAVWVILD